MLSVIILTEQDERPLVATLAALVPASAAGMVRDVILVDRYACDATAKVADAAGCHLLLAGDTSQGQALAMGAQASRSPWLLFLHAGAVLEASWIDDVSQFVQNAATASRPRYAVFRYARSPYADFSSRDILQPLRRWLFGRSDHQGLLIAREHYIRAGGHSPSARHAEAGLLSRLGRTACITLRSRIIGP